MYSATIANADLPSGFRKRYVERKKDTEHLMRMDKPNDVFKAPFQNVLRWILFFVLLAALIVTVTVITSRRETQFAICDVRFAR
jgi:hypothetical protein